MVAIVHKIGQSLVCLPPQPLDVSTPAIAVRIDRADVHENAISEFAGELAPYPLQRIDAAAAARAHHEHRRMAVRIEPWRVENFRICDPAQGLVRSANLSSNGCI